MARGTGVVGLASTSRRVAHTSIGAPVPRAEQLAAVGAHGGHQILMDEAVRSSQDAPARGAVVRADGAFAAFLAG